MENGMEQSNSGKIIVVASVNQEDAENSPDQVAVIQQISVEKTG